MLCARIRAYSSQQAVSSSFLLVELAQQRFVLSERIGFEDLFAKAPFGLAAIVQELAITHRALVIRAALFRYLWPRRCLQFLPLEGLAAGGLRLQLRQAGCVKLRLEVLFH